VSTPRQLSARVDADLARAIETLAPTGLTYSEIVKRAVAQFAEVYQVAVENKVAAPHEIPTLIAYKYKLPPRWQPPRTGAINLLRLKSPKE
jgi:MinD superfamily P-loop ATPase